MKQFKTGILLLMLCLTAAVGYAANGSTTKPPEQVTANEFYSQHDFIAQVEAPATDSLVTEEPAPVEAAPATPAPTASDLSKTDSALIKVADELHVTVNPNATPSEIADQITEAYKLLPNKSSPVEIWLRFILLCLGVIGTVFYFIRGLIRKAKPKPNG